MRRLDIRKSDGWKDADAQQPPGECSHHFRDNLQGATLRAHRAELST